MHLSQFGSNVSTLCDIMKLNILFHNKKGQFPDCFKFSASETAT